MTLTVSRIILTGTVLANLFLEIYFFMVIKTVINSYHYYSWRRFTAPIPYAAQVPNVRFRWEKVTQDDPNWALDNSKLINKNIIITFINIIKTCLMCEKSQPFHIFRYHSLLKAFYFAKSEMYLILLSDFAII